MAKATTKYTDVGAWDAARKAAQAKWEKSKSSADRKLLDEIRAAKPKGTPQTGGGLTYDLGVGPKGQIDPGKAVPTIVGATQDDTKKTFDLSNPGTYTDSNGNVRKIATGDDGTVKVEEKAGPQSEALKALIQKYLGDAGTLDLSNVPKVLTDNDLLKTREQARNAIYSNATKYLERDRSRDMAETRQLLANRGIPIDLADPNSAYGRAVGAVNDKYRDLDIEAQNQAEAGADARLATMAGVNTGANQAGTNQALTAFQAPLAAAGQTSSILNSFAPSFPSYAGGSQDLSKNLLALLGAVSGAGNNIYGIDKTYAGQMAALKNRGGGGGQKPSGGDSGFLIMGGAP